MQESRTGFRVRLRGCELRSGFGRTFLLCGGGMGAAGSACERRPTVGKQANMHTRGEVCKLRRGRTL